MFVHVRLYTRFYPDLRFKYLFFHQSAIYLINLFLKQVQSLLQLLFLDLSFFKADGSSDDFQRSSDQRQKSSCETDGHTPAYVAAP